MKTQGKPLTTAPRPDEIVHVGRAPGDFVLLSANLVMLFVTSVVIFFVVNVLVN